MRRVADFTFLLDLTNFKVFKTHSFVTQNNSAGQLGQVIMSPCHASEKQSLEMLKDLSEITKLVSGRVFILISVFDSTILHFSQLYSILFPRVIYRLYFQEIFSNALRDLKGKHV